MIDEQVVRVARQQFRNCSSKRALAVTVNHSHILGARHNGFIEKLVYTIDCFIHR